MSREFDAGAQFSTGFIKPDVRFSRLLAAYVELQLPRKVYRLAQWWLVTPISYKGAGKMTNVGYTGNSHDTASPGIPGMERKIDA